MDHSDSLLVKFICFDVSGLFTTRYEDDKEVSSRVKHSQNE